MEYFSRFVPAPSPGLPSFAGALLLRMASRVMVFFVRHVALLRPLSAPGKLQLAKVRDHRAGCRCVTSKLVLAIGTTTFECMSLTSIA